MTYLEIQFVASCAVILGWESVRGVCKLAEVPVEWDPRPREYLVIVGVSVILGFLMYLDLNVWEFELGALSIVGVCGLYYWLHKNPLEPIIVLGMVLTTRLFMGMMYAGSFLMNLNHG